MCVSIWNQGMNVDQESSLAKHRALRFECIKLFNHRRYETESELSLIFI